MRIINDVGPLCPPALLKAAEESLYRPEDTVIRVSELVDSPQIRRLRLAHWDHLEVPLTRLIPSLDGTAWHDFMESHSALEAGEISEFRMFWNFDVDGRQITLTGKIDLYMRDLFLLGDYKRIPSYKWVKNSFEEFEAKQNIYRQMLLREGHRVDRLILWCLIKDWSKWERMRSPDYPPSRLSIKELPIWTTEQTEQYIRQRLRLHFVEDAACTPEERWQEPTVYALKKKDRKTAVKVEASVVQLEAYIAQKNETGKSKIVLDGVHYWIEERPGSCVRCGEWCDVNQFCPFYQSQVLIEGLLEREDGPEEICANM